MSYMQKRHDRCQNRINAYKYIQKRTCILNNVYDGVRPNLGNCTALNGFINSGEMHRLSKGKIYCSCLMCREKTRELGYKHSEQIKMAKGYEE